MVFKLSSNGFSMDIKLKKKKVFQWSFNWKSKIQEGHHHKAKFFFLNIWQKS